MKYIIMCGGLYPTKIPKCMFEVNNEPLLFRTVRLLKERGITPYISTNDIRLLEKAYFDVEHLQMFLECGKYDIQIIQHHNKEYWLDAFYPTNEPVCYLFGDVYYTAAALEKIITNIPREYTFFGTYRTEVKKWDEPFAFKVVNQHRFRIAIEQLKTMADNKELSRDPISWELYRLLEGIYVGAHRIKDNFVIIEDDTTDADNEEELEELKKRVKK